MYCNAHTSKAALWAAGSVTVLVEEILSGRVRNGVALVRPPGHHAEPACAMGFCIFNNVAIAAQAARERFGVERVLIVDWDVHHGNGIQKAFEHDPGVLYFSAHRFDKGDFYPGGEQADGDFVGIGLGRGATVNVAWNTEGLGDGDYMAAWHRVLMPVAWEFAPQLVLVAAGFDAAEGDPLGGCRVSPQGFAQMLHPLLGLAGGRIAVVLEGGYHVPAICACIEGAFRVPRWQG